MKKKQVENLTAQLKDFQNAFEEINSKIQTESTREKLWELSEIIKDIEEKIKNADV